jgi:hypothetical protein
MYGGMLVDSAVNAVQVRRCEDLWSLQIGDEQSVAWW